MRRTTTAAIAATLLLTLTGCSSDPTEAEPGTPSPSASTSPEQRFLADAKGANFGSWKTTAPTDAELALYPDQWCAELKAGHSVAYILDDEALYPIGQTWGTAKADAQELVVMAVTAYCPEYRDQVTEELRNSGQY